MKQFHFCTIANNQEQYTQMLNSLTLAGFTEENSRITLFNNFSDNQHEPYSTLNAVLSSTEEPYVVFCHQDLIFDKGDGYNQLIDRLRELDTIDPSWAVAGNAGVNEKYKYVIRISDKNNSYNWRGRFPQKVFTLDENLLILNLKNKAKCSHNLSGFHLYGSDVCLHAIQNGYSCYVIDYHVTHLSGGTMSEAFFTGLNNFYTQWRPRFTLCVHKTITGKLKVLSRNKAIERMVTFKPLRKVVLFFNKIRPIVTPYRQ